MDREISLFLARAACATHRFDGINGHHCLSIVNLEVNQFGHERVIRQNLCVMISALFL